MYELRNQTRLDLDWFPVSFVCNLMAICNIIYDLGNVQCCFHCGSGKADKKRLKCVNINATENLFLFTCFGFKCTNSYLCNNCSNVLLSFGKKYINIKHR